MMKLYDELAADWYELFTPLHGYKEEADLYHALLREKLQPAPQTILELGSGAGHVAWYLKEWYSLTLTDLSDSMLSISQRINPQCAHHQGDMRTLRLHEVFDAVFIHDAVMYMTSQADLALALETAFIHCRPGGMLLVSPDYTLETFAPDTDHGGEDGGGRSIRFLSWARDPDPADSTYTVDYAFLMQGTDGSIQAAHEQHIEGLFPVAAWLNLLEAAGFVRPETSPDSFGRINFIAYRPEA